MDSSKRKDAKKKEGGNKACASTAQGESHSVVFCFIQNLTFSNRNGDQHLGGSNKVAEGRPKSFSSTVLNDLPPEIIDLIADSLSIMDCLNTQQAFARDPEQAVIKIRKGLAANLAKHRALYLLMDLGEYDGKYQYNYQMESELPNALLPTLEGLPIASEAFKMITLPELLPGGSLISIGRLRRTFPNVVELKVVLREWSPVWLTQLAKVVKAFSRQLTALQLLIFSDGLELTTLWGTNYLLRLLSHLNDAHFDRLRHFTLLFEDTEEPSISHLHIYHLDIKSLRLLSNETLEECYLRLPGHVIEPQLKLLGENQGLQQVGLIAYCYSFSSRNGPELLLLDAISLALAGKIVHLQFPEGHRSKKVAGYNVHKSATQLGRLEQFTSLATFRTRLNTDDAYLTLMEKLSRLGGGRLTHLELYLQCVPLPVLTFSRLWQLAPCSPSVTHLKIEVVSITGGGVGRRLRVSHRIFTFLAILRHFPSLQQLEVVFPRAYSCSNCKVTPADDGRKCMEKAMRPFRARDQLTLTYSKLQ